MINKHRTEKATKTITITKGMSSSKSTFSGGSTSVSVSGEVGLSVMKLFEATIGASGTFEHNWSLSTTGTEYQEVTSKKYPSVLSQEAKYQCLRLLASVKTVMALFTQ